MDFTKLQSSVVQNYKLINLAKMHLAKAEH